ncbi:hypothetical protein Clacol_008275 [Clathrus columnatus]|uniref:Histone-lysine N-methyltransferase SET5 n=1 Tax=Clathrus columnatus TaxID=1419009 RepID=A0AAV5ALP4_9AGAM|nr:hypothetical protein Clacol_008275 [Clathrus columnatus]
MTTAETVSPSEAELLAVLRTLRSDNPTLGQTKLHTLLLKTYPTWAVSEKRFRRIVHENGLTAVKAASDAVVADIETTLIEGGRTKVYPTYRISENLDISKWTKKVEVRYFGKRKGKGLVAVERIAEGETVWKEDPWIIAPEWEIYSLQQSSASCMYCTTPLTGSSLSVSCPSQPCPARFCNRLCLQKSHLVHPLLCPTQNPASISLMDLAKRAEWMGLHALAQQTARILLSFEKSEEEYTKEWKILRGFAEMGMEDRVLENGQTPSTRDRLAWKSAYKVYMTAFKTPLDDKHKKKLARLVKKVLPSDVENELFTYEGFLRGLGRMNLNLEAHGGLPNISVRHLDQRTALSRINIIALSSIEPGAELLVSYVNPQVPVLERRRTLKEWGFGDCDCEKCAWEMRELKEDEERQQIAEAQIKNGNGKTGIPHQDDRGLDKGDLEKELREGFGL